MIVICEECGKKYKINPGQMKSSTAKVKCKSCHHLITINRPESVPTSDPEPEPPPLPEETPTDGEGDQGVSRGTLSDIKVTTDESPKRQGVGLRGKMALLFFAVPIAIIAISGLLYLWQLDNLSALVTEESSKIVRKLGEDIIGESSKAVAKQCKLYLDSHPDLKKEEFNSNLGFRQIAVQKLGMTGYTALYERPGSDGVWRTWAHVNEKIIGIDMRKLEKPLGNNFPGFWKIYTGVKGGVEAKGYYSWQEKSGQFKDKYMVCTPVMGTNFVVAATTYLDDFTRPVKLIQTRAGKMTAKARSIIVGTVAGTLILIGLIVAIYGSRLIGRITTLTDIADRISIGELDARIDIHANDEIGALADAIGRMQESIRLSIERLRKRR